MLTSGQAETPLLSHSWSSSTEAQKKKREEKEVALKKNKDESHLFQAMQSLGRVDHTKDLLGISSLPSVGGAPECDWNELFQRILSRTPGTPEGVSEKQRDLENLVAEFEFACSKIVRAIIAEEEKPVMLKTYPPITGAGIAGGDKFCVQGIFIKYASVDHFGIYGSVENAAKSVNHEIRSMQELVDANIPGLSIPLACGIEWLGRKLSCQAVLPLTCNTLVYGSADGGRTIKDSSLQFRQIAEALSQHFNLAPHLSGGRYDNSTSSSSRDSEGTSTLQQDGDSELVLLHLPADLEGHLGLDGRFYALDTARLFPSEPPLQSDHRLVWSSFFRPEFVKSHWTPLNPDSFTRFTARTDPKFTEHRLNHLKALAALYDRIRDLSVAVLTSQFEDLAQPQDVPSFLHRRGINLRYLGMLLAKTGDHFAADQCLTRDVRVLLEELVARSLKCQTKEDIRKIPVSKLERMFELVRSAFESISAATFKQVRAVCAAKFAAHVDKIALKKINTPESLQHIRDRFLQLMKCSADFLTDTSDNASLSSMWTLRAKRINFATRTTTVDSIRSEISLAEKTFGRFHENVARAVLRLAEFYSSDRLSSQANEEYLRAIRIFEIHTICPTESTPLRSSSSSKPLLTGSSSSSLAPPTTAASAASSFASSSSSTTTTTTTVTTPPGRRSTELSPLTIGRQSMDGEHFDALSNPKLLETHEHGILQLCDALWLYACHLYRSHDLNTCRSVLQRCILLREKFSGIDVLVALGTELYMLGFMSRDMGLLSDAELFLSRAISIQALCNGHPLLGNSLIELARVYLSMGRRSATVNELQLRASDLVSSLYGPNHSQLAIILNNRAILAAWEGRFSEAEQLTIRAFEIRLATLGPDSQYVGHSLGLLGYIYMYTNRLLQAHDAFQEAFRIFTTVASSSWVLPKWRSGFARLKLYQESYSAALELINQNIQNAEEDEAITCASSLVERAAISLFLAEEARQQQQAEGDDPDSDPAAAIIRAAQADVQNAFDLLSTSQNPHHLVKLIEFCRLIETPVSPQIFRDATRKLIVSELLLFLPANT